MELDPVATPASPSAKSERKALRKIFIGQNGLRAGWRLAIFVLLANAIGLLIEGTLRHVPGTVGFFARIDHRGGIDTPEAMLFNQGLNVFVFLGTAAIMARAEKLPFGAYGLPLRHSFGKRSGRELSGGWFIKRLR